MSSARQLFAERGYKAVTMAEIAEAAGVSVQTIYDSVGNKRTVLLQIVDGMEVEAGLPDLLAELGTITEPREFIRWQLRLSRGFMERTGDLIRAVASGTNEPEIAQIREEGRRRHRDGGRLLMARVVSHAGLELSREEFGRRCDLLSVLSDSEMLSTLIDNYDWSLDDALDTVERILVADLLRPEPAP